MKQQQKRATRGLKKGSTDLKHAVVRDLTRSAPDDMVHVRFTDFERLRELKASGQFECIECGAKPPRLILVMGSSVATRRVGGREGTPHFRDRSAQLSHSPSESSYRYYLAQVVHRALCASNPELHIDGNVRVDQTKLRADLLIKGSEESKPLVIRMQTELISPDVWLGLHQAYLDAGVNIEWIFAGEHWKKFRGAPLINDTHKTVLRSGLRLRFLDIDANTESRGRVMSVGFKNNRDDDSVRGSVAARFKSDLLRECSVVGARLCAPTGDVEIPLLVSAARHTQRPLGFGGQRPMIGSRNPASQQREIHHAPHLARADARPKSRPAGWLPRSWRARRGHKTAAVVGLVSVATLIVVLLAFTR